MELWAQNAQVSYQGDLEKNKAFSKMSKIHLVTNVTKKMMSSYLVAAVFFIMIRDGSRTAATSKMECFTIIVNGWNPLTIITKRFILDIAAVLCPPHFLEDSLSVWLHFFRDNLHYFHEGIYFPNNGCHGNRKNFSLSVIIAMVATRKKTTTAKISLTGSLQVEIKCYILKNVIF